MYNATATQPAAAGAGAALRCASVPEAGPVDLDGAAQSTPGAPIDADCGAAPANNDVVATGEVPRSHSTPADTRNAGDVDVSSKPRYRAPKRQDAKKDIRTAKRAREGPGVSAGTGPSAGFTTTPKKIYYSDLGGIEDALNDIRQLVEYPLMHPEVLLTPAAG